MIRKRGILKLANRIKYRIKRVPLNRIAQFKLNNKPFKFKLPNLLNQFTNKSIAQLLGDRQLDIVVSKQCQFTGTTLYQETMTYSEFQSYQGSLTLYLAQVQLDLECPQVLANEGKVHLWCSKGYTDSGWHYDSYNNYLGVVEGIKIVYLSRKCDWNKFEPVTNEQYNHLKQSQSMNGRFITLMPDEMVFIPQGMFHRVISYDHTTGINLWMDGIDTIPTTHYQLRYQLNQLIKLEIQCQIQKYAKQTLRNMDCTTENKNIQQGIFKLVPNAYRTQNCKSLRQQIIIYLCLLVNYPPKFMAMFISNVLDTISPKYLLILPSMLKLAIATSLDAFSESVQDIVIRERFYLLIQQQEALLNDLKTNQEQLTKSIGYSMIMSHYL